MKKYRTLWDLIDFQRTKGLTINGIPLYIDENYFFEKKEVDPDGIVLYQEIEIQCELIRATEEIAFYVCHPLKRNWLENRVRRN